MGLAVGELKHPARPQYPAHLRKRLLVVEPVPGLPDHHRVITEQTFTSRPRRLTMDPDMPARWSHRRLHGRARGEAAPRIHGDDDQHDQPRQHSRCLGCMRDAHGACQQARCT